MLIHVHHLSYGATRVATDSSDSAFVYTSHDGAAMAGSSTQSSTEQIATRFVMSRADAVVALSKAEVDFQQRSYPLIGAIARGHTQPELTLQTTLMLATTPPARGRPWQLLYVGQLIALKNVDVLLHALALIKQPVELELVYHNSALEIPLRKLTVRTGFERAGTFSRAQGLPGTCHNLSASGCFCAAECSGSTSERRH